MYYIKLFYIIILSITACVPKPPPPSPPPEKTHITHLSPPSPPKPSAPIEELQTIEEEEEKTVPQFPPLPLETYTIVVHHVPVSALLFNLARDAKLNIDIHPDIKGYVTLNIINQTIPQILKRLTKLVKLRYQYDGKNLVVLPDKPYIHVYKISYVNIKRNTISEMNIATQIISGMNEEKTNTDLGINNSTTKIMNQSNYNFWENLKKNVLAILKDNQKQTNNVIINQESGIMTVRATHKQHQAIKEFLKQLKTNIKRQVLIEATIIEVQLNNQYQAGIDWQLIAGDFNINQSLLGANLANAPFYSIEYSNPNSRLFGNFFTKIRLLEQFGKVKVLSSPKIIALNNQTAILKIVDNHVYFTIKAIPTTTQVNLGGNLVTTFSYATTPQILPVGLIMNVTPQISEKQIVTLNIRPTISRIISFKPDPNPDLASAGVTSEIPEIQVREMETMLKIKSGNIAIIGGLMQDAIDQKTQAIPILSKLPMLGDFFTYRNNQSIKTELVIFLRPVVINE
jgi:MSHA type pilus biogenesis protein MshL